MEGYTKPPLGVMPAYIAAGKRIKDLAQAISRAINEELTGYQQIEIWAKEIALQCELVDIMDKERRENEAGKGKEQS